MVTDANELPEGTVTVLFTDVVGSTELTNRLGDEAARGLMRSCEEIVRAQLTTHRGFEVKGTGDGHMLAFTSARRAVGCAVDIQRAIARRNRQQPDQAVEVRIGLNTGEVIREDADLFGATVNAAARIAAEAGPGEILLPDEVRVVLGRASPVDLTPRGEVELRGFADPWTLHAVVWEDNDESATPDRAPMVGRDDERSQLTELVETAMAGRGSVVLLAGEAGVGKTRLTEEIIGTAQQRGLLTLIGHCHDQDQAAPYGPFIDMLQQALRLVPPEAMRSTLGNDGAEVARLLPQLRQVFDDLPAAVEHAPNEARRRLHDAILGFLERASAVQPILLVWEDLHWADDASLALIQHLARPTAALPLLILGTYRDTELSTKHPLAKLVQDFGRERLAIRLSLGRLSADGLAGMLRGLSAQEPPARLVEVIYRETEGLPFFVEEVFRHLAAEGKLFDAEGHFRADLAVAEDEVPASVRLATELRLERVSGACHQLLAQLAVAGRAFDYDLAKLITEMDDDVLLDSLEEAEAARLIEDLGGRRETRYQFTHELVRQTLIATLSTRRRQLAHATAARAMEEALSKEAEQHAAELAYHWYEAGAAGDLEKALSFTELAQQGAEALSAWPEAARLWAQGLELLDERGIEDDRLAQHLEHAEVLTVNYVLSNDQVHGAAVRLAELYEGLDQAEASARAHLNLASSHSSGAPELADPALAQSHLETALDLVSDSGDSPLLVQIYDYLAVVSCMSGRWREGLAAADSGVEMARRLQSPELESWSASWQGKYRAWAGQFEAGIQRLEEAWQLSRLTNTTIIALFAPARMGVLCSAILLDPRSGESFLKRELELARLAPETTFRLQAELARAQWQRGQRPALPDFVVHEDAPLAFSACLIWLATAAGKWDQADEMARRVLAIDERSGHRWNAAESAGMVGLHAAARGNSAWAIELFESTLDYYADGGTAGEVAARSELAILRARRGEIGKAREELAICEDLAEDSDWRGRAGQFAVARGLIASHEGDTDVADRAFADAIEIFQAYSVPWYEAEALQLWAEALGERGDRAQAEVRLTAAEEILRRIEAGEPWLERLAATRDRALG